MKRIIILLIALIITISCKKDDLLETKISKINTNINLERFDKIFYESTSNNLKSVKEKYPFMFPEKYSDSFWLNKKREPLQIELFNEVDKTISDLSDIKKEIESLLNHVKYYYPNTKTPRFITTTSDVDYRNKVIVTDTIVLIALDTYLGSNHKFYGNFSNYLKANFKKEQIAVDIATEYAKQKIYHPKRKTFLDEMIYFGKQLYFKDIIIPFKKEAQRIGYTQDEIEWAANNESQIWRYYISNELLFQTDPKLTIRFINPAPFSKFYLDGIDSNSPGKIGQYIGWQIVRAYMKQNDVPLKDMLQKNTEEIFNNSKFKPKK